MTKKEKILFSFITNIIDDEKPKTLHMLTRYDTVSYTHLTLPTKA